MANTQPLYPYNKRTNTITLPTAVAHEIYHLAQESGVPTAMKRVMELTGADLKVSKAYVDALLKAR